MRLLAVAALNLAVCALGAQDAAARDRGAVNRLLEKTAPVTEGADALRLNEDEAVAERMLERTSRLAQPAGRLDFDWKTDRVFLGRSSGGAVNSLQISTGRSLRTPGALPLSFDRAVYETDAYEVALRRDWSFARFDAGSYDVDITPHAGVGWSNQDGATAEAGATVRLTQKRADEVRDALTDMGVRDGSEFGDQGRWYMFAAASGRAVGLNVMREPGHWDQAGLSTDAASGLIGDAHIGVGWRKGPLQTSLGYVHRELKGQNMIWGQQTKEDSVVAFSLTIKPEHE